MKMTEKMKAVLQEETAKAGVELSEEELDGVSGGRLKTQREKEEYHKSYYSAAHSGSDSWKLLKNLSYYHRYIESLPDDAPEELYDPCKDYVEILRGNRK